MEEAFSFRIGDLVLYKNNQLIAFNKPPGLPTQEDKTGDKSLASLAEIYCKGEVNLVHRLDRPASGVVLFARTHSALVDINEQFKQRKVQKTYLAVVGKEPPKPEGTLIHYLEKNAHQNRTIAHVNEVPGSDYAELSYRQISASDNYFLLEIDLHTGRHHQIRAQLAAIGCPIKGDNKYGFKRANRDRSIHLHAWKLSFEHPVTRERVEIVAPVPEEALWKSF
ncbi:MAG: RluA family pseudouridine synthase [Saprospirales bacterium]|nr:RluA family pseudouridine synthase [Saprospirales bacterium]